MRNPGGPCGSELLISGNARHVIVVHAPKRKYYDHQSEWGLIPSLASEIELIHMYGSTVIAIALNTENCTAAETAFFVAQYEATFNIPVVLPLQEGCGRIIPQLKKIIPG